MDGVASSVESRLGLWKRVPGMAKMVMLAEAFVITFLSAWLYEEYVSNPYMGRYLNAFIQSDAGAMTILGGVVALVALATVGLLYRSRLAEKAEPVSTGTRVAIPVSTEAQATTQAMNPVSSEHLHPVVAALKAEIAGTPLMVTGTLPGAKPQEQVAAGIAGAGTGSLPENVVPATTETAPIVKKTEAENRAGEKTGSQ